MFIKNVEEIAKGKIAWRNNNLYKFVTILTFVIAFLFLLTVLKVVLVSRELIIVLLIISIGLNVLRKKIAESAKTSQQEVNIEKEKYLQSDIYKISTAKSKIYKIIGYVFIGIFLSVIMFIIISVVMQNN